MSKACLNCGAENADEAKFCRGCGQAILPIAAGVSSRPVPLDESLAETFVDSVAPSPYVPTPTGPGSLPPTGPSPSARSAIGLWVGVAAIGVALIAASLWWFMMSRHSAAPTFDSAPPPSALAASGPAASADELPTASGPEVVAPHPSAEASAAVPLTLTPSDSFDAAASGPAVGNEVAPSR
jgi:hypothetical protein